MAKKAGEGDEGTDQKATKHRSPNYPAISLPIAIGNVAKLYKEDGRGGAVLAEAVKHFGFGSPHGGSNGGRVGAEEVRPCRRKGGADRPNEPSNRHPGVSRGRSAASTGDPDSGHAAAHYHRACG